jgi:hypothetical protein
METTMSDPRLPAEMLDHIVDLLHDTKDVLGNCCLVSKSWIPRTRKHLFAEMKFYVIRDMRSWTATFPDPANSPARYTKTLYIGSHIVTASDSEVEGWIRGFSSVVDLAFGSQRLFACESFSLIPFRGFSPIKSLRMAFAALPSPWIFNLILLFPLLEDLDVIISHNASVDGGDDSDWPLTENQPSSPPMLSGSLKLYLKGGMKPFTRRLLSLPGGIHFRKLTLTWLREEDLLTVTTLVEECSPTLESLDITCNFCEFIWHLRPHPQLTSASRRVEVRFYRPLESDETQTCGV